MKRTKTPVPTKPPDDLPTQLDQLDKDIAQVQVELEEINRTPTWRELLPYLVVYVGAVLLVAWGTRFLPDDLKDAWWVHPQFVVDGVILLVILGFWWWIRRRVR